MNSVTMSVQRVLFGFLFILHGCVSQEKTLSCVGIITDKTDTVIISRMSGVSNSACQWEIQSSEQQYFLLTFTSPKPCSSGIKIHTGTLNSTDLCSQSKNLSNVLSGELVYIVSNSTTDFQASVEHFECGGTTENRGGNITLTFPVFWYHGSSITCRYVVKLPLYHTIAFDLAVSGLNGEEYVLVKDSTTAVRNISRNVNSENDYAVRLRNSTHQEVILRSCRGCFRRRTLNLTIVWTVCGGEVNAGTRISLPGRWHVPNISFDCTYILQASADEKIIFHLQNYNTPGATNQDNFQIFEKTAIGRELLRSYKGSVSDDLVLGFSDTMYLRLLFQEAKRNSPIVRGSYLTEKGGSAVTKLFSHGKNNGRGMILNANSNVGRRETFIRSPHRDAGTLCYAITGCGRKVYHGHGLITNPQNPVNLDCTYTIITRQGSRILLVIDNSTLPDHTESGYCSDFLQVEDVYIPNAPAQTICGNKNMTLLMSSHKANVKFRTNGDNNDLKASFHITYSECGGYFKELSGQINIEDKTWYKGLQHEKCTYRIGQENSTLLLLLAMSENSCPETFKFLRNSGHVCNYTNKIYMEESGFIMMEHHLKHSDFKLSWLSCNITLQNKQGEITITGELFKMMRNVTCSFTLQLEQTDSWLMSINNATSIHKNGDVHFDDTQRVGKEFKIQKNKNVSSYLEGNGPITVSVQPMADGISNDNHENVHIAWFSCNQTLTNDNGTFSSPGYPDRFFWNISCVYNIIAPEDKRISLVFVDLDLGVTNTSDGKCSGDFVEIYDPSVNAKPDRDIHCGKREWNETISYTSFGHDVIVRFISSDQTAILFKGFNISYSFVGKDPTTSVEVTFPNEYHEIKQNLMSYRSALATTVALGVVVGVLVFIVIAFAGFLVRQRKQRTRHIPVINKNSVSENTSPPFRRPGYIKKKDSNGSSSSTSQIIKTYDSVQSLTINHVEADGNSQNARDSYNETRDAAYDHLREQRMKKESSRVNLYASVNNESNIYNLSKYTENNVSDDTNEKVVEDENEYDISSRKGREKQNSIEDTPKNTSENTPSQLDEITSEYCNSVYSNQVFPQMEEVEGTDDDKNESNTIPTQDVNGEVNEDAEVYSNCERNTIPTQDINDEVNGNAEVYSNCISEQNDKKQTSIHIFEDDNDNIYSNTLFVQNEEDSENIYCNGIAYT